MKKILTLILIVIISCTILSIITMKLVENSSNNNDNAAYNIEIKSDDIIISEQESNKKLINTTSDKMLNDFVKNKDKAIKNYENATLNLKIDLSKAKLSEFVFINTDENDVETEVKTGLIGSIELMSSDKKYTLYIDVSGIENYKLMYNYKDKDVQKEYNLEKFKKLKSVTVKMLDTATVEFYEGEIMITADTIESYK